MPSEWAVSTLEAEGFNPQPIIDVTDQIRNQDFKNIHSFLIARNGKLVHEAYFAGNDGRRGHIEFNKDELHGTRSVTKSITSMLIPKIEMVIVFTGGNYGSPIANQAFKIVTKHILPAVTSPKQ